MTYFSDRICNENIDLTPHEIFVRVLIGGKSDSQKTKRKLKNRLSISSPDKENLFSPSQNSPFRSPKPF